MNILNAVEQIKTELAQHHKVFVDAHGQMYKVEHQAFNPIGRNKAGYESLFHASSVTGLLEESPLEQLTNKTNLTGNEIVLLDFSFAVAKLCDGIPDLFAKVSPSMSKLDRYITWGDLATQWRELWK